jgi:Nuclease-related domain
VPFWAWGASRDSAELDDSADELPPDRPEYPDGPDPEYQAGGGGSRPTPRPVVTPVGTAGEEREGIGQHLGNLAHLSGNPRMRIWQRRIIIAVIAGVVFGIVLNSWKWGLTFAVLAAIIDTIVRSRTVFNGPAGVRLTRAQRGTVRQLARMERKGYRSMHCVSIPDSQEQIDHLVVGPAGVFAIDSEDWDRRMPVRTSSHRELWHGPHSQKHRLEHARWEADQASQPLSAELGSPVSVRPTMAVYGPKIVWDVAEIRGVDVFSGPGLRKYLKRRARRAKDQRLSAGEIERIDKAAHMLFPTGPTS